MFKLTTIGQCDALTTQLEKELLLTVENSDEALVIVKQMVEIELIRLIIQGAA